MISPVLPRYLGRLPAARGLTEDETEKGLAGFLPLLLPRHLWFPAYAAMVLAAHLGQSSIVTAWYSLMSDMAGEKVRGRYFGLRNAIHAGVAIVTILAAGAVLDHFPGMTGFLLLHGGTILFGILNTRALLQHPEPARKTAGEGAAPWAPLANRPFRLVAAFVAAWTFAQALATPFYSIVMLQRLGLTYTSVSWLMATAAAATIGSLFLWGPLCDRLGEGRVISILRVSRRSDGRHRSAGGWADRAPGARLRPGVSRFAAALGRLVVLVSATPRAAQRHGRAVMTGYGAPPVMGNEWI